MTPFVGHLPALVGAAITPRPEQSIGNPVGAHGRYLDSNQERDKGNRFVALGFQRTWGDRMVRKLTRPGVLPVITLVCGALLAASPGSATGPVTTRPAAVTATVPAHGRFISQGTENAPGGVTSWPDDSPADAVSRPINVNRSNSPAPASPIPGSPIPDTEIRPAGYHRSLMLSGIAGLLISMTGLAIVGWRRRRW